jgi:hypothetical protein
MGTDELLPAMKEGVPVQTESFRHELKFFVNPHQYQILTPSVTSLAYARSHAGPAGDYQVSSLYFDDAADSALHDKLSGVQHREKIRVRIYGRTDAVIMLEKKTKHGDSVHKERLRIDRTLYEAMRNGDAKVLHSTAHSLLDYVAWQMRNLLLRPKVIVDYAREAYIHRYGDVRVTFDKSLRSGITNLDLFRAAPLAPAPVDGMTIMEVKYGSLIPRSVQDVLQLDSLTRQAASKYVLCRTLTKTHLWEDQ